MTTPCIVDELVESPVTKDGDLHHLVCCDDNTAMCGADVTNEPWLNGPAPGEVMCPECANIDEHDWPCTVPGCEYDGLSLTD